MNSVKNSATSKFARQVHQAYEFPPADHLSDNAFERVERNASSLRNHGVDDLSRCSTSNERGSRGERCRAATRNVRPKSG